MAEPTQRTERDLRRDLKIDELNLEEEWLDLPSATHYWAEQLSNAIFARDQAKSKWDVGRARLAEQLRDQPVKKGWKKPSEAAIRSQVETDPTIIDLNQTYTELKNLVSRLNNVVRSLRSKKTALEELTRLRTTDWHSEPRISREMRGVLERAASRAQQESLKKSLGPHKLTPIT